MKIGWTYSTPPPRDNGKYSNLLYTLGQDFLEPSINRHQKRLYIVTFSPLFVVAGLIIEARSDPDPRGKSGPGTALPPTIRFVL